MDGPGGATRHVDQYVYLVETSEGLFDHFSRLVNLNHVGIYGQSL